MDNILYSTTPRVYQKTIRQGAIKNHSSHRVWQKARVVFSLRDILLHIFYDNLSWKGFSLWKEADSDKVVQWSVRCSIFMDLHDKTQHCAGTDFPASCSNYRLKIPVCGEAGCSSSLGCLLEIWLGGLSGLQGSLGGRGDESFSIKAFFATL